MFGKCLQVARINGDARPRAILSSFENEVLEIVPQALLCHSYEIPRCLIYLDDSTIGFCWRISTALAT